MLSFSYKGKAAKSAMALMLVFCLLWQTGVSAFAVSTVEQPPDGEKATVSVPEDKDKRPESEIPPAEDGTGITQPTPTPVPVPTPVPPVLDPPVIQPPDVVSPEDGLKLPAEEVDNGQLLPPGITSVEPNQGEIEESSFSKPDYALADAWEAYEEYLREELFAAGELTQEEYDSFVLSRDMWDARPQMFGATDTTGTFKQVSARNHILALRSDNKLFGWGDNRKGQLGVTGETINTATEMTFFNDKAPIIYIKSIHEGSIVITADRKAYVAGSNENNSLAGYDERIWAESAALTALRIDNIVAPVDSNAIIMADSVNDSNTYVWGSGQKTPRYALPYKISLAGKIVYSTYIDSTFREVVDPQNTYTKTIYGDRTTPTSTTENFVSSVANYSKTSYDGERMWMICFHDNPQAGALNNISLHGDAYPCFGHYAGSNPNSNTYFYWPYNGDIYVKAGATYNPECTEASSSPSRDPIYSMNPEGTAGYGRNYMSFGNPSSKNRYAYAWLNGLYLYFSEVYYGEGNTSNSMGGHAKYNNDFGKLGIPSAKLSIGDSAFYFYSNREPKIKFSRIPQYVSGDGDTVIWVDEKGDIWASGSNEFGQLGQGDSFYDYSSNIPLKVNFALNPSRAITVTQSTGGTIVPNKTSAKAGEIVTVATTPNAGYELVVGSLKYNGIQIAGNSFSMPNTNVVITGSFAKKSYTVSVYSTPNGSVTVNKTSATPGDTVIVTVQPSSGYRLRPGSLKYNSVPMSGTSFSMPDGPTTVSAEFERTPYSINITQAANGTIQSSVYSTFPGDMVNLLITPNTGFGLKANGLKMNGTAVAGTSFVMPNGNANITAEFEASAYSIAVHPASNGSVSVDKPSARPGELVTVTASASPGYALKSNGITMNNTPIVGTTFTMPYYSVSVTALFEPVYYNITVAQPVNGSVTVSKSLAVINEGVLVSAIPNPGYKLKDGGITVNGTAISGNSFAMPNNHVAVSAQFEPILFSVVVNNTVEGTISVNKTQAYTGDMVSVVATPTEGYRVRTGSLKYDNIPITTGQFKMPANDAIVTCEYDVIYNNVIVLPPEHGVLTASKRTALLGDTIIVNAVPDRGYSMSPGGVMANGTPVNGNSFLMPLADVTLTTQFQPIMYDITTQESTRGKIVSTKTQGIVNELIELSIMPNDGYQLKANSLRVNGVIREEHNFVMPANNVLVTADFEPIQFPIEIPTTVGGITRADRTTAKIGDLVKIQTIPDTGFAFDQSTLRVNGNVITVKQFTMPPEDVTVEADYRAIDYVLKSIPSDNGQVFVSKSTANISEVINLTIKPDDGYRLVDGSLRMNGMSLTGTTFVMPASDVTITASFETIQYAINVPSVPNGRISVNNSTSTVGSDIRVTVMPNTGYKLKEGSLTVDSTVIKDGEFKMPAKSVQLAVEFEPIVYDIECLKSNNGTVSTDKTSGIMNDKIAIITSPAEGYRLISGSIRLNGVSQYGTTFMMPAEDATISAEFEPIIYTVKITQVDHGTITVDKPNATIGQDVIIKVEPDKGYQLKAGSVMCEGIVATDNKFVMPAKEVTVTAEFEKITYKVSVIPTLHGIVTTDKSSAQVNDKVEITTLPSAGYRLIPGSIKVNDTTNLANSFTMTAEDTTVTAEFEPIVYSIKTEQAQNGTIIVDKPNATIGQEVNITIKPDKGYSMKADSLKINGEVVKGFKFIMPASTATVTVQYEKINYDIKSVDVINGKILFSKTSAQINDNIVLTITPDEGYKLVSGSVSLNNEPLYAMSFSMPAENVEVTAKFSLITYSVGIEQADNGKISTDKQSAVMGEEVSLTVKPARGYRVKDKSLRVNGDIIQNGKFVMPATTANITVAYEKIVYDIDLRAPMFGMASVDKLQATYGDTVTLILTPSSGYSVGPATVKVDGTATQGLTFSMPDKDAIVTVEFVTETYSLNSVYFSGGRVSFDKPYAHIGEDVTVFLEPDSGYKFVDGTIRINGDPITGITFKMPARDVKPEAKFEPSVVSGMVTDADNKAVGGIEVVIESAFYSDKMESSSTGAFSFKLVPNGRFKLRTNDYLWTNAATDVEVKDGKVITTEKPVLIIDRDRSVENVEKLIEKLPPQTSSTSVVEGAHGAIQNAKIEYDLLNAEQKNKVNDILEDKLRILFAKITPIEVEVLSSLDDITVTDVELSINKEQYITLETSPKDKIRMQVFINPLDDPTVDEELLVKEKINETESVLGYMDITVLQKIGTAEPIAIDQLNKPITISIGLQDKESGAKYKVVRLHDDEATLLPTTLKDSKLVFKTDKFSTYAIVSNVKSQIPGLVENADTLFWEGVIRKIQKSGPWDIVNEDISTQQLVPAAVVQTINDWTGEMHFVWGEEAFMLSGKAPVQILEQKMFFTVQELIELSKKRPVMEQPVVETPINNGVNGSIQFDYDGIFSRMSSEIAGSIKKALPNGLFSFVTGNKEMTPLDTMLFIALFTVFIIVISVTVIFLTPAAKVAGAKFADDFNRKLKKKKKRSNKLTTAGSGRLKNSMSFMASTAESARARVTATSDAFKEKRKASKFRGAVVVPDVVPVVNIEEELATKALEAEAKAEVDITPDVTETPVYKEDVMNPQKTKGSLSDWLAEDTEEPDTEKPEDEVTQ